MAEYNRQDYYNYYSGNSYKDGYNQYNYFPYPSATQTSVSPSPQQMNRAYNQPNLSSYFRNGNPSFNHPPNPNYSYNSMNQNYSTVVQNHNNPNQSYSNTIPTPLQQYANPNQHYNEQSLNQHYHNSNVHNGYSYPARQQYQQREYGYSNGNTPQNPPVVQQQASSSTNSEFDAQEEFGDKLISYARFNRNNELMKTIVSDVVMPDVSTYITSNRLKVLSDQVYALKTHQKKVAIEIDEIEKDFKTKKQELNEKAIKFQEEYKKLCEPALTPEDFEDMVNKSYDALKRNMELLKWQKTLAWAHETAAASGAVTTAKSEPLLAEILAATPLM